MYKRQVLARRAIMLKLLLKEADQAREEVAQAREEVGEEVAAPKRTLEDKAACYIQAGWRAHIFHGAHIQWRTPIPWLAQLIQWLAQLGTGRQSTYWRASQAYWAKPEDHGNRSARAALTMYFVAFARNVEARAEWHDCQPGASIEYEYKEAKEAESKASASAGDASKFFYWLRSPHPVCDSYILQPRLKWGPIALPGAPPPKEPKGNASKERAFAQYYVSNFIPWTAWDPPRLDYDWWHTAACVRGRVVSKRYLAAVTAVSFVPLFPLCAV